MGQAFCHENLKSLYKLAARTESMEAFEKSLDEVLETEAKKADEKRKAGGVI